MNKHVAALAAIGTLLAGQAFAADPGVAQLSSVKGTVIVSQNGKFVPATGASALRVGDRVVAKDGQAQLKFADGCVISLKAQGMATIGAKSPCASGSGLVSASQGSSAQLFGSDAAVAYVAWGAMAVGAFVLADDDDVTVHSIAASP